MFRKLALFLVTLIVFSGCAATTNLPICNQPNLPSADIPNTIENSLGEPIMWDQWAFPLQVTIDPNMTDEKEAAVFEAMEVWEQVTGLDVFVFVGHGPDPNRRGTIWVTEQVLPPSPCGGQYLGLAHRRFGSDIPGIITHMESGFIEFHSKIANERLVSTAVHEFGHILGLNHDPEIESIMYPYNQPERSNQLTDEDVQFVIKMIEAPREPSPYDFGGLF